MQEILTVIAYLVVWLICKEIVGIQSGLVTLIISLGAAVLIYVLSAVRWRENKKKYDR
ncbi:MAG: hypothetical protein PHY29_10435 [Syntrophales bacterium]|nr:hypothetical protein [Syntrophales bacterium]